MHVGRLLSKNELTLFMDYGQFDINGGLGEWDAQLDGLNHAMADPPSYSDGTTIVVLSPHQNNFDMRIVVETWSQQPPSDGDRWQQVSVERLAVGPDAQIHLSSPPDMSGPDIAVPAGKYLVEISGRGFVNYGWPGDTKPGDDWRLRLWPDDGAPRPEPQRWHMPGYGTPPVVPYRPPVPQPDPIGPPASDGLPGPKLESTLDPGLLRALGIRTDADQDTDPVAAQVDRYNGGGILAVFDRDLIATIVDLAPERQRAVAIWCVEKAFAHAGLGDRPEFTAALAALRAGEPLPEAVADVRRPASCSSGFHASHIPTSTTCSTRSSCTAGMPRSPHCRRPPTPTRCAPSSKPSSPPPSPTHPTRRHSTPSSN